MLPSRPLHFTVSLAIIVFLIGVMIVFVQGSFAANSFAHESFRTTWYANESQGFPVWGRAISYGIYEKFIPGPDGERLVQYFEKGRMEINNPLAPPDQPGFVSSGLIVLEMVTGSKQIGYDATNVTAIGSCTIPIAGDLAGNNTAPTYATINMLPANAKERQPDRCGQGVQEMIQAGGIVAWTPNNAAVFARMGRYNVFYKKYDTMSGHNIPNVFSDFFDRYAWSFGNWRSVLGNPLTEPYWTQVTIDGLPHDVLVQVFERRVLTYTPANPWNTQVQMSNSGIHYMMCTGLTPLPPETPFCTTPHCT